MNSLAIPDSKDLFTEQEICLSIHKATEIIRQFNSKNSLAAYEYDIRHLKNWVSKYNISIYEIRKEHLIAFIMENVDSYKISTIKRRIASLSRLLEMKRLPNPCVDKQIKILMRKLTDKYGCSRSWGKAITLNVLNDMLKTCEDDGLKGIRDTAMLLFAFSSGGRRRSEVSNCYMQNLVDNGDGTYIYNLGKSKTNQSGEYDPKPIMGRAAIALRKWLEVSKIKEGPIFRGISKSEKIFDTPLCDRQIAKIIKSRCEKAGYDPKEYTAHSLRSGFVTESGKRGKPLGDVMAMTGHRSLKEVMRYYKTGNILNNSAAYLAG